MMAFSRTKVNSCKVANCKALQGLYLPSFVKVCVQMSRCSPAVRDFQCLPEK